MRDPEKEKVTKRLEGPPSQEYFQAFADYHAECLQAQSHFYPSTTIYSWFGDSKLAYPYPLLNLKGHDLDDFYLKLFEVDSKSFTDDLITVFSNNKNLQLVVPNEMHFIMSRLNEPDNPDSLFINLSRTKEDKDRDLSQIDSDVQFVVFYSQWCPDCLEFLKLKDSL